MGAKLDRRNLMGLRLKECNARRHGGRDRTSEPNDKTNLVAELNGFKLFLSNRTNTGYKCVQYRAVYHKQYSAQVYIPGTSSRTPKYVSLGRFYSAVEAALAVAMFTNDPEDYMRGRTDLRTVHSPTDLYAAQQSLLGKD